MSDVTIIILVIVFWRLVIGPAIKGFRYPGNSRKKQDEIPYSDYEEVDRK
ncbi:MAG: hypothetical protein H6548_02625 [Chitinophagales bacterium]|nr:hypothetical protein [Chitinophagales bacterium]MCB9018721.1 hypothetical protein [Chitinophagales bacterium]MCB9020988.1 hypothetical protein [Chitinophagales bacterium]HPE97962.1 hypothetical protein [Chitinophagales bacterium]HPR28785.1 hypothetical protein [Chitinophagales bacterium]